MEIWQQYNPYLLLIFCLMNKNHQTHSEATRLLSNSPNEQPKFESSHYCTIIYEDAPISSTVIKVKSLHAEGKRVLYKITRGNRGGLFSINRLDGSITVAAHLDHEIESQHTLTVEVQDIDSSDEATIFIRIADVNDNLPVFQIDQVELNVIENDAKDLPKHLAKIWANDPDWVDQGSLLYTLIGDGVDGYAFDNALFAIDPRTGDFFQLKPLDGDPPNGKFEWKLRVKVHDGQSDWVTTRSLYNRYQGSNTASPVGRSDISSETFKDNDCDLIESTTSYLNDFQKNRLKNRLKNLKRNKKGDFKSEVNVVEAEILVRVENINDNPPIFITEIIQAEVQENGPKDLYVTAVTAWDADDAYLSSDEQRLSYYLEQNAVDESTRAPIFRIDSKNGEIRTNLCCLDRETTSEYRLQVVATDVGGLKGTCTVAVRLSDVNDNRPMFSRQDWEIIIDETYGDTIDNRTLFEITVSDPDTQNHILFRVMNSSGWGWDRFGIRTAGVKGDVYGLKPLDFEDNHQRNGFRFIIEVTDQGNWKDHQKITSAWITVKLRDINDNSPVFKYNFSHISILENIEANSLIASIPAYDPDEEGLAKIDYSLLDNWGDLEINDKGDLRILSTIDREGLQGARGTVRIVAVDRGSPRLSATATLSVEVLDVNDCAPKLVGNSIFHVAENVQPTRVGVLLATDDDIWGLGHGPPFKFELKASNSNYVFQNFKLEYIEDLDSRRGGALLSTIRTLDREKQKEVSIIVDVSDAGGLTSFHELIVIVDDVNDNDMFTATKTIFLWKSQGLQTESLIGRVYVDDLDDWDFTDKSFIWAQNPHPQFTLSEIDGSLSVSPHILKGQYDLRFYVTDHFRGQRNVSANVTVDVRALDMNALPHSVPLIVHSLSPYDLTYNWTPSTNGGILGQLLETIKKIMTSDVNHVLLVSITDGKSCLEYNYTISEKLHLENEFENENNHPCQRKQSILWISAKDFNGNYIPMVKFKGLLSLYKDKISKDCSLIFDFDAMKFSQHKNKNSSETLKTLSPFALSSSVSVNAANWSLYPKTSISATFPNQVIDANRTSLITPNVTQSFSCPPMIMKTSKNSNKCSSMTCLNGGKCHPDLNRCLCQGWTWGAECKALSRSFSHRTFAWLQPLPTCLPLHLELFFFPKKLTQSFLLYSGLHSKKAIEFAKSGSTFLLQVADRELQLFLRGPHEEMLLKVRFLNRTIINQWHHVEISIDKQQASLILDYCPITETKCSSQKHWRKKKVLLKNPWKVPWQTSLPLQIGGIAQDVSFAKGSFWGCLSKLRIQNKLVDLGSPLLNQGSVLGCEKRSELCEAQNCLPAIYCNSDNATETPTSCYCLEYGTNDLRRCSSRSAYTATATKITKKLTVLENIYPKGIYRIQFQFRTNSMFGSIMRLVTSGDQYFLYFYIMKGNLCLDHGQFSTPRPTRKTPLPTLKDGNMAQNRFKLKILELNNWNQIKTRESKNLTVFTQSAISTTCLTKYFVSDDSWHLMTGGIFGRRLILDVDDGEDIQRNWTILTKNIFDTNITDIILNLGENIKNNRTTQMEDYIVYLRDLRILEMPVNLSVIENDKKITNAQPYSIGSVKENTGTALPSNFNCDPNDDFCEEKCPLNFTRVLTNCKDLITCSSKPSSCLNEGICQVRSHCICSQHFVGEFCQWKVHQETRKDISVSPSLVAVFLISGIILLLALFSCLSYKCYKKRKPTGEIADLSLATVNISSSKTTNKNFVPTSPTNKFDFSNSSDFPFESNKDDASADLSHGITQSEMTSQLNICNEVKDDPRHYKRKKTSFEPLQDLEFNRRLRIKKADS